MGIVNISFTDVLSSIQEEVDKFANAPGGPVTKVICVGHVGLPMDKRVAAEIEGVDVVIGGHTNSFLYTGERYLKLRHPALNSALCYQDIELQSTL